jgi:hypothetical protein
MARSRLRAAPFAIRAARSSLSIGQEQRLPHAGGKQTGPSGIEGREACFLDCGYHCGLTGKGHNVSSDLSGDRREPSAGSAPFPQETRTACATPPSLSVPRDLSPHSCLRQGRTPLPYIFRLKVCTLDWASVVCLSASLGHSTRGIHRDPAPGSAVLSS